ncbi:sulfite oxidase heme-binding subunit YedZ, partial [Campylobacter coli]|nr:sulfite oxidase heme-binding subunit YedZ [Campylobacter coli]
SHRLLEAIGFIAFLIIFLMLLSSFKIFKKLSKIRKLGYLCLILASYHYFLTPKIPMFWEWSALMLSLVYFMIRYLKFFKFKKA